MQVRNTIGAALVATLIPLTGVAVDYDALVKAVTAVESGGNPLVVGTAGERGLMQIKPGTWRDMTRLHYGKDLPFDYAFHSKLNQRIGRTYLQYLSGRLESNASKLKDDALSLMVASYNLGPNAVADRGYHLRRLPARTRRYVERVLNMYEYYLSRPATTPAESVAASATAAVPETLPAIAALPMAAPLQILHPEPPPPRVTTASPIAILAQLVLLTREAPLLPLLTLALLWALYRGYRRSRATDGWSAERMRLESEPNVMEFDFVAD